MKKECHRISLSSTASLAKVVITKFSHLPHLLKYTEVDCNLLQHEIVKYQLQKPDRLPIKGTLQTYFPWTVDTGKSKKTTPGLNCILHQLNSAKADLTALELAHQDPNG
jgi:hypothetical protein